MTTTEEAVRQTLKAHEDRDYDTTDLLDLVRDEVSVGYPKPAEPWRRTWLAALAAAAVVVSLAAGGWWLSSQQDRPVGATRPDIVGPTATSPSDATSMPPPGTKFVGYRRVMFTVPEAWVPSVSCGQASRTIRFPTGGSLPTGLCMSYALEGIAFRNSIVGPSQLLHNAVSGGLIRGDQLLLTDVERRGSYYEQSLALPARHFYVNVFARQRSVVNGIIESVQAVPHGYTVVPEVRGSSQRAASRRLSGSKLSITVSVSQQDTGPPPLCCPAPGRLRVVAQLPDPGSVVTEGTRVRLRLR